jgi:hypothetical protein
MTVLPLANLAPRQVGLLLRAGEGVAAGPPEPPAGGAAAATGRGQEPPAPLQLEWPWTTKSFYRRPV